MRILYIGTGDIGLPALNWLLASGHEIAAVITQPDKPAGRKMELRPSPIKTLAIEHGVAVFQPAKLRAPDAVAQVQSLAPDLIVVMAYGQILPKGVLDAPRIACINLHGSILPRHRGAAPVQAAILAGDNETGITVMYMDEGLDTGDILLIERVPIHPHDTGRTLHDRLAEIAPKALEAAVAVLEAGVAPRIPQDNSQATYAKKLGREDGEIQWDQSCAEVDRHIRAMNPWPGAFTFLPVIEGTLCKLKVFKVARMRYLSGPPGQVLRVDNLGICVACASGAIILQELQLEGKRRMPVHDFLLGHPLAPGVTLGVFNKDHP